MATSILFWLAPIVSGLLVTVSLPSFDLGFLAWLALSPLLFCLRQKGPFAALGLGFLFGLAFTGSCFYWLNAVPDVTPSRFLMLIAALSVYPVVFALLYNLTSAAIGSWVILAAPALWVALEYARVSLFFLAVPWNLIAHSQYRYLPLIQIADMTGVYGISFLIVTANQVVSEIPDVLASRRLRINWPTHLLALGLLLVGTLAYGWFRLAAPEGEGSLRVAVVQANVLARDRMSVQEQMQHLGAYARLTMEAAKHKPDLVIWPSSSLPAPYSFGHVRFYVGLLARQYGTPLVVGGSGGDKFPIPQDGLPPHANTEFLITPSGRLGGQYNKVHLTPFTEYLPLDGRIKWPPWITALPKSFVPGDSYTLFQVSHARFGTPICWESLFPDIFRRFVRDGAHFMVNVTNEGVFGVTSAPYQTLAMNAFRAVENRVTVVRAATTGISAFISSKGEILDRVKDANGRDLFVSGILVRDVPLSRTRTFYTVAGDVFAYTVIGVAALVLGASIVSRARVRVP
ncbi:MAG: apolipoprotein N-acyltransferase [Candidatus Rokubacteria bacterium]|nr:apolipoprotein N-acyltransferase [Candidatus Rokubacteria bacterium]